MLQDFEGWTGAWTHHVAGRSIIWERKPSHKSNNQQPTTNNQHHHNNNDDNNNNNNKKNNKNKNYHNLESRYI